MENLLITPEGVYIDGEHNTCDNIVLILPDGQALDINTAIAYLQKKYKPTKPKKLGKLARIKKILSESHPLEESDSPLPTASARSQTS